MIKGISKQIIEIKCTNNEYFEKALLFVNSSNNLYDTKLLNKQAKLFAMALNEDQRRSSPSKLLCPRKIATAAVGSMLLILLILGAVCI